MCPGQRSGPGFLVRKIGGGAPRDEELYHRRRIGASRPGERSRPVLVVSRCDVGAGVEQDGRTFDLSTGIIGSIAEEVKQRLALPVHQVGTHAVRQQRAKHIEMFQEITLAAGDDGWYANACLEEPVEQLTLSERADRREG